MNTFLLKENKPIRINGHKFGSSDNNYRDKGYECASRGLGKVSVLADNLEACYREFIENFDKETQPEIDKIIRIKNANAILQRKIEETQKIIDQTNSERIPLFNKKKDEFKEEILDIRSNPQKYECEKTEKTSYIIGTIILIFLTCYLIVFYSSASYSGFFRMFEPGVNLREAMLDPNTYLKALND
jgi:hypothetical protein